MNNKVKQLLAQAPIIPVITIRDIEEAAPLAKALVDGGLPVLEITLRTDAGLEAISNIIEKVPHAIVGAGTVLSVSDMNNAVSVGSEFFVTPGTTDSLFKAAKSSGVPFLPGVSTVSEIVMGLEYGVEVFKFFPAEASGGVKTLKAFSGPLPEVYFCPTGGIGLNNLAEYLSLKTVLSVGGSWVVSDELIAKKDWQGITTLAKEAVEHVNRIRSPIAVKDV